MKLPKAYDAKKHEKQIYELWEKSGVFIADPTSDKPHFSIAMPPPNETGTLHVGHALFLTLQDILTRHARQTGHDTLWLPGTDHAAIATNAIIEKRLAEEGTDKHKIGREEFIKRVREFVSDNRDTINSQIKAMGASCDWSRARYTLDEALNRCVNEVFVKMYHDGLIYRGHRIVNWDPKLETTVSDDEMEHKEQKTPFYTLQFGPFQIGTARPETKFGDKYVVMHPDDERYKQYEHLQTLEVEWINGPITATVIKDEAVDPGFGTGAMTITPWHDRTDFEIAERHGLEKDQIIDFDGKLLSIAGEFEGQGIAEARPKIVQKLTDKGLVVKIDENYVHSIALNSRGKGVIEPQIKLQWFVDVNRPAVDWKGQQRSFKEVMRAVIEDGDIKIVPGRFEKVYFHWIDNLRDWCISRQIWWGHQIPVWYKGDEVYAGVTPPEGPGPASAKASAGKWEQDPDTLDTWFSSALWTWSTLVDPELAKDLKLSLDDLLERSIDFKTYHPTTVMETGWDILFFWVARMILATTYVTKQVPFKTVYLHGLVRTEAGKKMSKSDPDTIIDPMEVIPEFGTDALRLALVAGTGAGNDMRLGKAKIVANRNFANKLWNVARYIEGAVGLQGRSLHRAVNNRGDVVLKTSADHWILDMLSITTDGIAKDLERFHFSAAYEKLYHFIWDDLADWYVEASKAEPNSPDARGAGSGPRPERRGEILVYVLDSTLKIAHPFAPFVTETIWQSFQGHTLERSELLISQAWPEIEPAVKTKSAKFEKLKKVVTEVRRVASILELKKPKLIYKDDTDLEEQEALLLKLANLGSASRAAQKPAHGLRLPGVDAWLDVDAATARRYVDKLQELREQHREAVKMLEDRLKSENYLKKAPTKLVEETQTQLKAEKAELERLNNELQALKAAAS